MGLLAALGLAACVDAFTAGDCRTTRTCPANGQGGLGGDGLAAGGEATAGGLSAGGAAAAAGEETAFTVLSVSPEDNDEAVEPGSEVVIEFSEPLDEATVTSANIQLLDGDQPIAGELSYADKKVTFTPQVPLALLARYQVSVSVGVTDVGGAPLFEASNSSFSVRDGIWTVASAVSRTVGALPLDLPFTEAGNVLLTWSAAGCSPSARWFNGGLPLGPEELLTSSDSKSCGDLRVRGTGAGNVLVTWQEDYQLSLREFKGGAWEAVRPITKGTVPSYSATAGSSDGVIHHLETGEPASSLTHGLYAYVSDATGMWPAGRFTITDFQVHREPQLVVDKSGRALAAWLSSYASGQTLIGFSSYSREEHSWAKAGFVTGSVAKDATVPRGNPKLALDDAGEAMAVWIGDDYKIMASRSRAGMTDWFEPVAISGSVGQPLSYVQPSLVFDGKTFVAAWTARVGSASNVYAARYDMENARWDAFQQVSDVKTHPTPRMPMLSADANQNLMLVWVVPTSGARFGLVCQRYNPVEGRWAAPRVIEDASLRGEVSGTDRAWLAFGMGSHGQAAVTWGDGLEDGTFSAIHLASFD